MGLQKLGTRMQSFSWICMRPHANRNQETVLRVILSHDRDSAILRHPEPFYRVERSSLLDWSIYNHGLRPVNLDHIFVVVFTRSQLCRLNCIGSVYRLCRDLLLKNRAAILSSLEVNVALQPWGLNLGSQVKIMSLLGSDDTPKTYNANEPGKCNLKKSWGARASRGIAVILRDVHLIGGHELAVRPLEATVNFIGLVDPRSTFLCTFNVLHVLRVLLCVTACAWCDHFAD